MNNREELIHKIKIALDYLGKEVPVFLLFTKNRKQIISSQNNNLDTQIKAMAEDLAIQSEITAINEEFLATEMDGLN